MTTFVAFVRLRRSNRLVMPPPASNEPVIETYRRTDADHLGMRYGCETKYTQSLGALNTSPFSCKHRIGKYRSVVRTSETAKKRVFATPLWHRRSIQWSSKKL